MWDDAIAAALAAFPAVPSTWLLAVIGAESSWTLPARPTWEANAGEYSYGPMQVLGSTARGLGFKGDYAQLADPATGIYWGAAYLNNLISRYGTNPDNILSAYNAGHPDPVGDAQYLQRVYAWWPSTSSPAIDETSTAAAGGAGVLILLAIAGYLYTRRKSHG